MKLLLALGNPGPRYRDTRHNTGWWLADRLVAAWSLPPFREDRGVAATSGHVAGEAVRLWKPLTYMNRSGEVVRPGRLPEAVEPERDLLVLVDDVALEPGRFRLRGSGSAGGHQGLASVEAALGTRTYGRLRIGVGRPRDDRVDLAAWVLAPMSSADEERVLEQLDRMAEAVRCWMAEGMDAAMNRYN